MYVIYTNVCLSCRYRLQIRYLNNAARKTGTPVKTIDTRYSIEARKDAMDISSIPMPFVYDDQSKKTVQLLNIGELL